MVVRLTEFKGEIEIEQKLALGLNRQLWAIRSAQIPLTHIPMQRYRNHGIAFEYPDDWQLDEDHGDENTTITVADEGTSFWSLTLMWNRPPIQDVLEEIEQTFRGEYDEIDIEERLVPVARREAQARDISFVCMELVNSALIRVFRTGRFTVLVLAQATDHEFDAVKAVFADITDTLDVDLDGDVLII